MDINEFILTERCALRNALNKVASVERGVECGFLNDDEAKERIMVIRNEMDDELGLR